MNYSIKYYKEKDTDPMVFLQRFRCTTEPIGGGTEYDEEGELVSWEAAVAAIEIAKKQLGWHPASELPELNEYGNSEPVYALFGINNSRLSPMISCVIQGKWHDDNIKWWRYLPKEE